MTFLLAQLIMMLLQNKISQCYMFGWVNLRERERENIFGGCLVRGGGEKKIGEVLVFSL